MTDVSAENYGFPLPTFLDSAAFAEHIKAYDEILLRRQERWKKLKPSEISKSRKMKRFVRKGIPRDMRKQLWMKFSGADERLSQNPNKYRYLLTKELDPITAKVIAGDVPRTFPDNVFFRSEDASCQKNLQQLQNVLTAFAVNNPDIGYCQGLNFVAGLVLLVLQDEESSFWLLDTIVKSILQPYYAIKMEALQIDCLVLEELIRLKVPKVFAKIQSMNTNCIAMCTAWFVCLYIDILPIETTLRILDCLIYEGDKVLFRVALSMMQMFSCDFVDVESFPAFVMCFKNMVANKTVLDCHVFLDKCFKIPNPLSYKLLKKLRKSCKAKLENLQSFR